MILNNLVSIPSQWANVELGEVIEIYDRKRIPLNEQERQKMKGHYPYCGANGIIDYIDDYIFEGEYLLIAEDGGYWRKFERTAYIMNGKFWVNNHAHIVKANENETSNHYLKYWFIFDDIDKYTSGTTRKKLNQSILKTIKIILPPLVEQNRITHILSTIDEEIEETNNVISFTNDLKKSLLHHLFTYGPVPIDQRDSVELQETAVGLQPKEWGVSCIEEISTFVQYGTSKRCDKDDSGLPVLRIPNVIRGEIDTTDLKYINLKEQEIKKLKLENGDLLFVRTNGNQLYTGRCAVYHESIIQEALFASYLIRVRVDIDKILPDFLQLFTETTIGRSYLCGRASSSSDGKFNINSQTIKSTHIPLPEMKIQREIFQIIHTLNLKIVKEKAKSEALNELFRALLEKLMTGQIRVNDLNLEEIQT